MILEGQDGIFKTEDILETIKRHGHEIAVVLLPGIQYYTGQFFNMDIITKVAQEQGCVVGEKQNYRRDGLGTGTFKCNHRKTYTIQGRWKVQNCGGGGDST